jgi:hypothetical protein
MGRPVDLAAARGAGEKEGKAFRHATPALAHAYIGFAVLAERALECAAVLCEPMS